jgi:ATP-dependent Lhr-like helicase
LARLGPPAGAGRWSLVAPLVDPAPAPTEVAHAISLQLLERHGVVTREAVRAEGTPGGFAGVYPVLRALEEAGRARRGWFVAGLGAAQFALPGAVDRLRAYRTPVSDEPSRVVVLAATDPAQPYGAALSWPEHSGAGRPSRTAGAHVVLIDGQCVVYVERGGRALLTFEVQLDDGDWADALVEAHKEGRLGRLQIERIDDEPARTSPHAPRLRTAGFADGYKGLTLHK